jgi:hypothetical protein
MSENGDGGQHPDSDLLARAKVAARKAVKRTEERNPLANKGIMPKLLIGDQAQRPGIGPNYSLLPEGDKERQAAEQGNPIPLTRSKRYLDALDLLEELDAPSGFNAAED